MKLLQIIILCVTSVTASALQLQPLDLPQPYDAMGSCIRTAQQVETLATLC